MYPYRLPLTVGPTIISPHVSRLRENKKSYAFTRFCPTYLKQHQPLRSFSSSAIHSSDLTHLDGQGRASMVDVSEKSVTKRSATAKGRIVITERAYDLINMSYSSESQSIMGKNPSSMDEAQKKVLRKGDTLTVAQLAAIMGSKKTSDLIPLCHPLPLTDVKVKLTCEAFEETQGTWKYSVVCQATVACEGKTGVEMEALTAVSVGLLTIWDMLKAVAGKEMVIGEIMVSEKSGGRSGEFHRP